MRRARLRSWVMVMLAWALLLAPGVVASVDAAHEPGQVQNCSGGQDDDGHRHHAPSQTPEEFVPGEAVRFHFHLDPAPLIGPIVLSDPPRFIGSPLRRSASRPVHSTPLALAVRLTL